MYAIATLPKNWTSLRSVLILGILAVISAKIAWPLILAGVTGFFSPSYHMSKYEPFQFMVILCHSPAVIVSVLEHHAVCLSPTEPIVINSSVSCEVLLLPIIIPPHLGFHLVVKGDILSVTLVTSSAGVNQTPKEYGSTPTSGAGVVLLLRYITEKSSGSSMNFSTGPTVLSDLHPTPA